MKGTIQMRLDMVDLSLKITRVHGLSLSDSGLGMQPSLFTIGIIAIDYIDLDHE